MNEEIYYIANAVASISSSIGVSSTVSTLDVISFSLAATGADTCCGVLFS